MNVSSQLANSRHSYDSLGWMQKAPQTLSGTAVWLIPAHRRDLMNKDACCTQVASDDCCSKAADEFSKCYPNEDSVPRDCANRS